MPDNSVIKKVKIKKIISETDEAKTFVLQPLDDWNPEYKAGQFLTVIFNTPFGEKRRSYSISSSPGIDNELFITVKRMDNGEFSRQLIENAKEGDVLVTSGISGFFCLPEDISSVEQFFFFAAGSGITPCIALIKTLLA